MRTSCSFGHLLRIEPGCEYGYLTGRLGKYRVVGDDLVFCIYFVQIPHVLLTPFHPSILETTIIMKTSTAFLTLASLLASTLAVPVTPHIRQTTDPITWSVTNWIDGCSPGGCVYSFNISTNGPGTGQFPEPEFSTFCQGIDDRAAVACDDTSVLANEVGGSNNVTLVVQHTWRQALDDGSIATFNIIGNHTVVFDEPGPLSFQVPQYEETAVA